MLVIHYTIQVIKSIDDYILTQTHTLHYFFSSFEFSYIEVFNIQVHAQPDALLLIFGYSGSSLGGIQFKT